MLVEKIEVIELDDNIAKAIIKLNEKGFVTDYCCGGHPDGAYIKFNRLTGYMLDDRMYGDKYKYIKKINHPVNWYVDRENIIDFVIRRKEFTQEEYLTYTDDQLSHIIAEELYNWINLLPNLKTDNMQFRIIDED
jgi:hypothetical protein